MCGAAREVKAQDLSGFGKFVDLKFEHFWEKVPHAAPFLRKGRRKALAHIPSGLGIEGIFWVVGHSRRRAKHEHCTRLPFGVLLAVSSFIGPVVATFCLSLVRFFWCCWQRWDRFVCFNLSGWCVLCFTLFVSKIGGTNHGQISNTTPKRHQKEANWNQKGAKSKPNGDRYLSTFNAFLGTCSIWVPFWRHLVDLFQLSGSWILKGP